MNIVRDTLWQGRLCFWQPARKEGYRFSLDTVLLAAFARGCTIDDGVVLDLGAGCGILGILLLATGKAQRVIAVEWQKNLADLAERNAAENGFTSQMEVVHADVRAFTMPTAQRAQHVVFNPPYFAEGHGIVSPNLCRALARHAQPDVLSAFLECAVRNLAPSGWISHVMRADQKQQYTQALLEHGLFSRRLREIKTRAHKPTRAVLCEAQNHISHSFLEEAPLIVHRPCHSALTEEVEQWVSGVFKAGLKNASEVKHGRPV